MALRELGLRHFRNLGTQELRFPPEGVAVVGENAQGKTNLLEAVYYLESLRSFRGAGDSELVAFEESTFHLRGLVEVDGERTTTVRTGFDRARRRKKVSVDGKETERIVDGLGLLGAVVFSPSDVNLVNGGPRLRRRFLDMALSLDGNEYVGTLSRYRRALANRNAALRAAARPRAVEAWDDGLVFEGARVTQMRRAWVADWSDAFSDYATAISGRDSVHLAYRPDVGRGPKARGRDLADGEDAIRVLFADRLRACRDEDRRRGSTTVGPHRDELLFTIPARHGRPLPARSYGSGGQRRTAALALRLTEAAAIRKRRCDPLLLLDDAFVELDEERSRRVMELLAEERGGQVILTAPKASDARLRGPTLERWHIRDGVIEA